MDLGPITTGAGVTTTFQLPYLPQILTWTQDTGQFTSITVESQGAGTLVNLNAVGLTSVGQAFRTGDATDSFMLPLANGILKNRNTVITVTNSGAQTPNLYARSEGVGTEYYKHYNLTAKQYTGATINNFMFAGFTDSEASDIWNFLYNGSDVVEKVNQAELRIMKSLNQFVDNSNADFGVWNRGNFINRIQYLPQSSDVVINVSERQHVRDAFLNTPQAGN